MSKVNDTLAAAGVTKADVKAVERRTKEDRERFLREQAEFYAAADEEALRNNIERSPRGPRTEERTAE